MKLTDFLRELHREQQEAQALGAKGQDRVVAISECVQKLFEDFQLDQSKLAEIESTPNIFDGIELPHEEVERRKLAINLAVADRLKPRM